MKRGKNQNSKIEQTTDTSTLNEQIEETAANVPDLLLEYLRNNIGDSELQYANPPTRILGGKSLALLFGFELSSPPEMLAGPLVLRLRADGWEKPEDLRNGVLRELALQDAAGRLGCKVPKLHLKDLDGGNLGGPFFIMERVAGGSIMRWWYASVLIGIVTSLSLWNGWPLLVWYLFGSFIVGLNLGLHQLKLHSLNIEDVKQICRQHELNDTDIGPGFLIEGLENTIKEGILEELQPGLRWIKENQPSVTNPRLCHGDIHPGNVMSNWFKVTGIIDWGVACVTDPECDVAFFRSGLTRESGLISWLILFPLYIIYRAKQGKLDSERLRYYQALRALHRISGLVRYLVENETDGESGLSWLVKTVVRGMIKRYIRFFQKLTGVRLFLSKETVNDRKPV